MEQHEPHLFDVYTDTGRNFIQFAAKCMKEEKEDIKMANSMESAEK